MACIIIPPANLIRSTDPGLCSAVVFFAPPPTNPGGCGVATTIPASGSIFPKGVNVVQCYLDGVLQPGVTFNVIVNDNEPPVITLCPLDIVVDATSPSGTTVNFPPITATDNCPGVVVNQLLGLPSGSMFPIGVTPMQFQAVDTSGNTSFPNCDFTITVNAFVPTKKKNKKRLGAPPTICCNPQQFKDGVCPPQVNMNGFVYVRIGDTNCFMLVPKRK